MWFTHLGAEAVADSTDLGDAQITQRLDTLEDNGVHSLGIVLAQPGREVEAVGTVQRQGVAVEEIRDEGHVALGGEVVGHELAVLPDADHVGDVEDAAALLGLALGRRGQVGVDGVVGDLDVLALGLAPEWSAVSNELLDTSYGDRDRDDEGIAT